MLLNILDGLNEASGRVIIMTSNHPEKLDRALVRPGRIDINVHFQKASAGEIANIVRHYWDIAADAPLLARELVWESDRALSAADVVNACRSSASAEETYLLIGARAVIAKAAGAAKTGGVIE